MASPAATGVVTVGVLCGLGAALIWGGGAVVLRHLAIAELPAADLALLRYAGCFPVALAAVVLCPRVFLPNIPWGRLLVLLLLAGPPYHVLIIWGYAHAGAGTGSLLVTGLLPIMGVALAAVVPKGTPGITSVGGAMLSAAGLAVFAGCGSSDVTVSLTGFVIFTSAAALWAVLNQLVLAWRIDPLRLTVALALWSPLFLPFWLFSLPRHGIGIAVADLLLQLIYHGWLVAIVATILSFMAVRQVGAQTAGLLQAMTPIFAALLGLALLGERLTLGQVVGATLTLAGVLTALRSEEAAMLVRRAARTIARRAALTGVALSASAEPRHQRRR